jgi:hypothetical protein
MMQPFIRFIATGLRAVRAQRDEVDATKGGISVKEEAQAGTVISTRLLGIADEIQGGTEPPWIAAPGWPSASFASAGSR